MVTFSNFSLKKGAIVDEAALVGELESSRGHMHASVRPLIAAVLAAAAFAWAGPAALAQSTPTITSAPPAAGVVGNGYLHQFSASADMSNPTFVVSAGSLPPGLALQTTGFVTGTPLSAGSVGPTTVCAVSDPTPRACQTFTISVSKRWPAVLGGSSPGAAVGTAVHGTASLVGGMAPTGTVTFRLFADSACTAQVFTSTNPVSAAAATSNDFTPTAPGTYLWTASYSGDANNEQASSACQAGGSVAITGSSTSQGSLYHALPPARILDTRYGAPVPAGGTVVQTVTGVGGVPTTGVSAVVLNVTVTEPTAPSFLTVYPNGAARPATANLSFDAGQTVPNLVVAEVGAEGKVAVYNAAGTVQVILDVAGWFGSDGTSTGGGSYNALAPARILDTRSGTPVPAGGTMVQTVTGVGGVPASGVSAVVLDVSVTQPTAPSFLTIYPTDTARPFAANLTYGGGQTVTNVVVAKVGADGKVAVYNAAGSAHVIFDVVGWFGSDGASSAGGRYSPVAPARLLDTRSTAPVPGGGTVVQTVTGVGGIPSTGVSAVVLDVSVTQPTAPSFLTVYPSGTARPLAASMNFVANQTLTGLVVAKVGPDGKVAIYNGAGSAQVIVDVVGWYSA